MDIADKIDASYDQEPIRGSRNYIGASNVGNPCDALLAFSLRGYPETPPKARIKRIFALGHLLEKQIIRDLKKAEIRVWEKDGLTGQQFAHDLFGGHVSCHLDGQVEWEGDEVAVLEIKTMGDRPWKDFVKKGVTVSHPQYFAQCQLMMGMGGYPAAVLVAYNKNTSEYHSEIIEFDEFEYSNLLFRAEWVMANKAVKISVKEDDWRCRGCFKHGVCWQDDPVPKRCDTCAHAIAREDGDWYCQLHDEPAVKICGKYFLYKPEEREDDVKRR